MKVTIELDDKDYKLIEKYADKHNVTMTEFIIESVLERIENEYDLKVYEEAMAEYEANPVSYSFEDLVSDVE